MLLRLCSGLVAMAILIATTAAQSISVPDRTLYEGETIDVTYSDPNIQNRFVHVTVNNGDHVNPQVDTVEIWLGPDGKGSRPYTVRTGWWGAVFNCRGAAEVTRPVSPPGQDRT
jgi:hypothetical protein